MRRSGMLRHVVSVSIQILKKECCLWSIRRIMLLYCESVVRRTILLRKRLRISWVWRKRHQHKREGASLIQNLQTILQFESRSYSLLDAGHWGTVAPSRILNYQKIYLNAEQSLGDSEKQKARAMLWSSNAWRCYWNEDLGVAFRAFFGFVRLTICQRVCASLSPTRWYFQSRCTTAADLFVSVHHIAIVNTIFSE